MALLGAVLLVGGAGGYAYAGAQVYQTLSAVSGDCHPWDAADTPQSFTVKGVSEAELAGYAMPAPRDVEFRSRDGRVPDLVLRAWWIPGADEAGPTVIVVHGRDSCRRDENTLLGAGMLHRNGFGVLLVDLRDHGDSDDEDGRFAAGTEEYLDVLGAWDFLVARGVPAERVGLMGLSFGAGTVTTAGGREPRVRAVWEDSGFADLDGAMRDYLRREGYPDWLAPGGALAARVISGDDILHPSPLDGVPAYRGRPLAITHGVDDDTILVRNAEALRDAATANGVDLRECWLVPGMGHTRAIIDERVAYEPRLVAFFEDTIGTP